MHFASHVDDIVSFTLIIVVKTKRLRFYKAFPIKTTFCRFDFGWPNFFVHHVKAIALKNVKLTFLERDSSKRHFDVLILGII